MKRTLLFLLIVFALTSYGQEKQVFYFDRYDRQVNSVEDAYIIREIEKPTENQIFSFRDFFKKNRKLMRTGSGYFQNNSIIYHGKFVVYNQNQVRVQELNYEHGQNKGVITEYYENGKLYRKFERVKVADSYDFDKTFGEVNDLPNVGYHLYKINYLQDSLGKVFVSNGNGHLIEKLNYLGEDCIEEGNYLNGFRDGLWKGRSAVMSKSYEEYYHKGVLKRGTLSINGKLIRYSELFRAPNYKYANNHIAHLYLADSDFYKKYNPTFQKNDRGDYWVVVTLSIDENGDVDSIFFDDPIPNKKVEKDITDALLGMPKWKPAVLRGLSARAKYSCAIPFFKSMQ